MSTINAPKLKTDVQIGLITFTGHQYMTIKSEEGVYSCYVNPDLKVGDRVLFKVKGNETIVLERG